MTLYLPPGAAHVIHSIALSNDPEPMACTYAISASVSPDPATVQALADELHDAWGDVVMPSLGNIYTLRQTEVRFQEDVPPADPIVAIAVGDRVGGTANTVLPQNSALLVHKRTATPGRRGRGRLYVPGCLRELQVDWNGMIESVELAGLQTAYNNFLTRVNSAAPAGWTKSMALLHTPSLEDPTPSATPVTSLQVDRQISTQRRRLRK